MWTFQCRERERLWADYYVAAQYYSESVANLGRTSDFVLWSAECDEARRLVLQISHEIRRHTAEHGCEPQRAAQPAVSELMPAGR